MESLIITFFAKLSAHVLVKIFGISVNISFSHDENIMANFSRLSHCKQSSLTAEKK